MSDIYQALAHPARRKILALLRKRAMSAGEIAESFDLAKPTLSGHFSVLRNADLISVERQGATLIYRINLSVAEEALSGLMDIFRIGDVAPLDAEPVRTGRKS
ncbi:MAG: autorepressor SdpR family transcription factor [Pseudomonadota bacterium]|nr:autorepressor SdpR family transcription factor [Pseudomonadota bacterium]